MVEKSEINSLESLSKQKLLREIENIRKDTETKDKELKRKRWLNGSVIVGVLSLFGVLYTQFASLDKQTKQYEKENGDREIQFSKQIDLQKAQFELSQRLERKKYKGEILIKAFDGKDTTETKKRILFLIDNHLIDDVNDTLRKAANKPNFLPSNKPTPTFNVNSPMPTITIANDTRAPIVGGGAIGNGQNQWKTRVVGYSGDVIAVQIYFKNTSNVYSRETTLSIKPSRTSNFNEIKFTGGVASLTVKRSVGNAFLQINGSEFRTLKYIEGSARWYPNQEVAYNVNPADLLEGYGFNIGDMPPNVQGVLVANFLISN